MRGRRDRQLRRQAAARFSAWGRGAFAAAPRQCTLIPALPTPIPRMKWAMTSSGAGVSSRRTLSGTRSLRPPALALLKPKHASSASCKASRGAALPRRPRSGLCAHTSNDARTLHARRTVTCCEELARNERADKTSNPRRLELRPQSQTDDNPPAHNTTRCRAMSASRALARECPDDGQLAATNQPQAQTAAAFAAVGTVTTPASPPTAGTVARRSTTACGLSRRCV